MKYVSNNVFASIAAVAVFIPDLVFAASPVATSYAADLSGCGIYRDCISCGNQYGCQWNSMSGCTSGFGASLCPQYPIPDVAVKPTCSAYADCESCTTQAGCVFYKGQCAYSRGIDCLNDPWNCVNYPSQCPVQVEVIPTGNQGDFCNAYNPCNYGLFCSIYGTCMYDIPQVRVVEEPVQVVSTGYCQNHNDCDASQNQWCDFTTNRCQTLTNVHSSQPTLVQIVQEPIQIEPTGYCQSHNDCDASRDQWCDFTTSRCETLFN